MGPRRFPLFPCVVLLLWVGALAFAGLQPDLERNLKGWLVMGLTLLTALILLIWFFVSRRFSGQSKIIGLVGLGWILISAKLTLRVDGVVDGRGLPKLAWRWASSTLPSTSPSLSTHERAAPSDPRLAAAANVPQFFGPSRDGHAPAVRLSSDWLAQPPKELWRQPVGAGWSAFAVVDGLTYTQEQRGEEELVSCYDLLTGAKVWTHSEKAHFTQWQGGEGPRATPTVMGGHVYAYGATGILHCLDAASGKTIWRVAVLESVRSANLEWGVSASPLVVGDCIVVTPGSTRGSSLLAFDRKTGKLRWQVGDDESSYASPLLTSLVGRSLILNNAARSLAVHDPITGKLLTEHAWGVEKWPKASQPVAIAPDRIFLSAGYGMGCQLLKVEAQADGTITLDTVWTSMKMKTQFNSPAYHQGHFYGLDDGRLSCMEAATGERLWKEGRFGSGQTLLCGDLVLVQNEDGHVHLCAAHPSGFKEFGKIAALSSKTWNHPVLAGRYLLVRNDREAVCYELALSP
jgi:outer membrane protein assembly factor BamB